MVELLQTALGFLIGTAEGDSVESCSGGLLGKEVRVALLLVFVALG